MSNVFISYRKPASLTSSIFDTIKIYKGRNSKKAPQYQPWLSLDSVHLDLSRVNTALITAAQSANIVPEGNKQMVNLQLTIIRPRTIKVGNGKNSTIKKRHGVIKNKSKGKGKSKGKIKIKDKVKFKVKIKVKIELTEFVNQMNHSQALLATMTYLKTLYPQAVVIDCHPTQSSNPKTHANDLNLYDPQTGYYICVEASFKKTKNPQSQSHKDKLHHDLYSLYQSNPAYHSSGRTPLSQKRCFIACSTQSLTSLANILNPSQYFIRSFNDVKFFNNKDVTTTDENNKKHLQEQ